MKDTIYRQDTMDAIYECIEQIGYEHNSSILSILQAVREVPSAEPEPRWISVTDKLPEKDGKYLVWAVMSYTPDHVDEPCECQQIAIASFLSGKYGSDFYGNNIEKVIAWMSLPEAYAERRMDE